MVVSFYFGKFALLFYLEIGQRKYFQNATLFTSRTVTDILIEKKICRGIVYYIMSQRSKMFKKQS